MHIRKIESITGILIVDALPLKANRKLSVSLSAKYEGRYQEVETLELERHFIMLTRPLWMCVTTITSTITKCLRHCRVRKRLNGLVEAVQEVTQNSVEVAFVDKVYTGNDPKNDAKDVGIELIVVKLSEAQKDLYFCRDAGSWDVVLHGLHAFFRRLARDFERTPETFRSLHFLAFAILMLHDFVKTIAFFL